MVEPTSVVAPKKDATKNSGGTITPATTFGFPVFDEVGAPRPMEGNPERGTGVPPEGISRFEVGVSCLFESVALGISTIYFTPYLATYLSVISQLNKR